MQAIALGAIGASLASNALFGRHIGGATPALSITPHSAAFAIWGLIYPALLGLVALQWRQQVSERANALLSAALFCCAAWTPLFTRNTTNALAAAAVALTAAATLSCCAVVALPNRRNLGAPLAVELVASIFAGWLCLAAALSVAIALRARGVDGGEAQLLTIVVCACVALALAAKKPFVLLPVLWGVAFMPPTREVLACVVLTAVAAVLAFVLRCV